MTVMTPQQLNAFAAQHGYTGIGQIARHLGGAFGVWQEDDTIGVVSVIDINGVPHISFKVESHDRS